MLYKSVSNIISEAVQSEGVVATKTPIIRGMRSVKKDTLRLVDVYIGHADDLQVLAANFTPPLFETILLDYKTNVESAREPEVLKVTATVVQRLGSLIQSMVSPILDAVFESTLSMITKDFSEYPEHRVGFFNLIKAINSFCFPALLQLSPAQFKLFLDSIIWSFKHTIRDIGDMGLAICLELLTNFSSGKADKEVANGFYQTYLLSLLSDMLFVLTDTDHKSGFKLQCQILAHIFEIVPSGQVSCSLPASNVMVGNVPGGSSGNVLVLQEYSKNLLSRAFPHLMPAQISIFVQGLFDLNKDLDTFKAHVRDFLIQLKEFAGDNTDLFIEEHELEQQRKKQAEMEAARMIPGLVKPSDLPDDMGDD